MVYRMQKWMTRWHKRWQKSKRKGKSRSAPGPELSSVSPFGRSTTQMAFVLVPAGESVFGKIVSSSSTPAVIEKQGSSSVFGTAFNPFQSAPNVFGGPVFGVPAASSSASPKIVESPKPPISVFSSRPPSTSKRANSIIPSTSTILQETKPLRSLADIEPLVSEGEEDRVSSSEAIETPAPPPFPTSQSAPTLDPFAPSFEAGLFRASKSATSFPPASRASLPPLKTDSPLSRTVDPTRGFTTSVDSPSQSFLSPLKHSSGSALSLDTSSVLQSNDESKIKKKSCTRFTRCASDIGSQGQYLFTRNTHICFPIFCCASCRTYDFFDVLSFSRSPNKYICDAD
ncbi:SAC3_2 [Sanghuangporus weigelae]